MVSNCPQLLRERHPKLRCILKLSSYDLLISVSSSQFNLVQLYGYWYCLLLLGNRLIGINNFLHCISNFQFGVAWWLHKLQHKVFAVKRLRNISTRPKFTKFRLRVKRHNKQLPKSNVQWFIIQILDSSKTVQVRFCNWVCNWVCNKLI